jgi:hypothetical protein
LSASANLLAELKEKFGEKQVEPYGYCIPIHFSAYLEEWTRQLEDLGCKVLSQSLDGEVYYFVRSPQTKKNETLPFIPTEDE